ncbi:MAG: cobaltochelatase subunit CobN [Cohaesibacter sp.]|jgi:cobaltochelatase CobN|nr:cobaltochelatase subunit CobN [Cohaesibacter sp.]
MHVIFREQHGLEDQDTPQDLGQSPADLVVLSFSDSDLGAFAAGWHRGGGELPSLRLANLVALKHPLSVDTYIEQTLYAAKGILIRLIGGENYWSYGLAQLRALAVNQGIALAVLPADGREDPQLDAASTLPVSTLRRLQALCDTGGAVAAQAALAQLALAAGLYAAPVTGSKTIPQCGYYHPDKGVIPAPDDKPDTDADDDRPLALIAFYRAYLTAADTDPVDKLITALEKRGFRAIGLFAPSLKSDLVPAWVRAELTRLQPSTIISAFAFSAKGMEGEPSPLDATGCPVFQVSLSTARRRDWVKETRGLSPADLAMHVVLPEVDGRIFAGVISFKAPGKQDEALEYSRFAHKADPQAIELVADRIANHHALSNDSTQTAATQNTTKARKAALILSTYPGKDWQMAHAVGLDTLASANVILGDMKAEGWQTAPIDKLAEKLTESSISWPLEDYLTALDKIPQDVQQELQAAWGEPEKDPHIRDGKVHFKALVSGHVMIALQPERGLVDERIDDYHDLSRVPCHNYVAFYLWLQQNRDVIIHMGAHGTLEWLPGKAVALSASCWPQVLAGNLPVVYPFIVNDPGEAAQAKRRIAGITIGHMPPQLSDSTLQDNMGWLESLLDEYSTADGLDPARRDRLIDDIRTEAQSLGVEEDLGIPKDASTAEAITRIDSFVCDIKESQYGDGLHIFGTGDYGKQELDGLRAALGGRHVEAGPSGSPFRGRQDVLPTGRNLYTTDPRSVPTRSAHAQGVKLAEELLRRHLQDHGDWPKSLVIDLWGSATMRTAGEEIAMALHLAGISPTWSSKYNRVSGFEIIPLALLNRPRIDVTLRVSGLFRDIFPDLAQMFEAATTALADRDEEAEDNPYLAKSLRVFGPRPGDYGLNIGQHLHDYGEQGRAAAGEAWLEASSYAITAKGDSVKARSALEERVSSADGFIHLQDLPETDLLMASDYAAHEAGFAAAAKNLTGSSPALYHMDITRPDAPKARLLSEEIARVVRARAANPNWANGMMRHGFRGGAEIAATLDHMAGFANLAQAVPAHLFDLYYDATLGRPDLVEFMAQESPEALASLRSQFQALYENGLWITRRNSIAAEMEASNEC